VASRPKFWPRPQSFGIGLDYYVIGHISCKNRVKFRNFAIFPAIILNHMLVIITCYFFIIIFGLCLDLDLKVLASASRFWPRLTSLLRTNNSTESCTHRHYRITYYAAKMQLPTHNYTIIHQFTKHINLHTSYKYEQHCYVNTVGFTPVSI